MICVTAIPHLLYTMIDMEREPEDYINDVKKWILATKDRIYTEILNTETGKATDLYRYEDKVAELGKELLRAIQGEREDHLQKLGWPQELMDCIRDPSVNLVIKDFIQVSCILFPNTNSIYGLNELKKKQNVGLE